MALWTQDITLRPTDYSKFVCSVSITSVSGSTVNWNFSYVSYAQSRRVGTQTLWYGTTSTYLNCYVDSAKKAGTSDKINGTVKNSFASANGWVATSSGSFTFNTPLKTGQYQVYIKSEQENASSSIYKKTIAWTVSYDNNGGSGKPANQIKVTGVTLKLSTTKPTRTGYGFKNWNTASNGSGTPYSSGANYTTNEAVTLYAQWDANTYTLSYNGNGADSGSTASQTKTYNQNINLQNNGFIRKGYEFVTWNTAADGSGTDYAEGASYSGNGDQTFFAIWNKTSIPVYIRDGNDIKTVVKVWLRDGNDIKEVSAIYIRDGNDIKVVG